jgi:hypothetical protein
MDFLNFYGGGKRIRTADPPLAKRMLYQLSYTPENFNFEWPAIRNKERSEDEIWWA